MCGGVSAIERFRNQKNDQIAHEMARLANLKQGFVYSWPTTEGIQQRLFGGHARSENLDSVWAGKIIKHVNILASSFSERDTISGSKELKSFPMPANKAIHGVVLNNGELRIVTKQAEGEVARVHHRAPDLVNI